MIVSHTKFVPYHEVLDHLRLGWCPSPALAGTHHGEYSVLMLWQCDCDPPEFRKLELERRT
jgi:hypothetical protein